MIAGLVRTRELAGWPLDDYEHRPDDFDRYGQSHASELVAQRTALQISDALLEVETADLFDSLSFHASRTDLRAEMAGFDWSLGVVDLRFLLAFQRRLFFRPGPPSIPAPIQQDWPALIALSFGETQPAVCDIVCDTANRTLVLRSGNPNLHLRLSADASNPIIIHAGSPFFEVAHYRGRWFLRDGYHRAYALLRTGVFKLPAVIVRAKTLEDLGAAQPWFFPEEILLSPSPPHVTDFLDDTLNIEYDRPPLIKTLRVTMEETLTSAAPSGEQP